MLLTGQKHRHKMKRQSEGAKEVTTQGEQGTKPFSSFEDDEELEREHEETIADFDRKHGLKNKSINNGKDKSSSPKAQQPRPAKSEYIQKYSHGNTLIEAYLCRG